MMTSITVLTVHGTWKRLGMTDNHIADLMMKLPPAYVLHKPGLF